MQNIPFIIFTGDETVSMKALIIDGSVASRKNIVNRFQRTMLETLEATTAEEGLKILSQPHNIRLVMIDNHLPDMQGFDLCKKLRDIPHSQ